MANYDGFPYPLAATEIYADSLKEATLTINSGNGVEIVRVRQDGNVWINPTATLNEAAIAFWNAVRSIGRQYAGKS